MSNNDLMLDWPWPDDEELSKFNESNATSAPEPSTLEVNHAIFCRRVSDVRFEDFLEKYGVSFTLEEQYFVPKKARDAPVQCIDKYNTFRSVEVLVIDSMSKALRCTGVSACNAHKRAENLSTMFWRRTERIMLNAPNLFMDRTRMYAPNGDFLGEFCVATLLMRKSIDQDLVQQFHCNEDFGRVCYCPLMVFIAESLARLPCKK